MDVLLETGLALFYNEGGEEVEVDEVGEGEGWGGEQGELVLAQGGEVGGRGEEQGGHPFFELVV